MYTERTFLGVGIFNLNGFVIDISSNLSISAESTMMYALIFITQLFFTDKSTFEV